MLDSIAMRVQNGWVGISSHALSHSLKLRNNNSSFLTKSDGRPFADFPVSFGSVSILRKADAAIANNAVEIHAS